MKEERSEHRNMYYGEKFLANLQKETDQAKEPEQWAKVQLMGHTRVVGRITFDSKYGGLTRVDIPDEKNEGGFRTELYGPSAIFGISFLSEEMAKAEARVETAPFPWHLEIIPREQYDNDMREMLEKNELQIEVIEELSEEVRNLRMAAQAKEDPHVRLFEGEGTKIVDAREEVEAYLKAYREEVKEFVGSYKEDVKANREEEKKKNNDPDPDTEPLH